MAALAFAALAAIVAGKLTYLTAALLGAVLAVLVAYNLVAALDQRPGDTLGEVIVDLVHDHPILVFLVGFLCGHLFWS